MIRPENRNYAFSGQLIQGLIDSGLRHVCLCPGSRSTPLSISFARRKEVKTWVHLDERSAGFFALGIARGTKQPVAVVTTSGTAAANVLPAVIEARLSNVPLVVITADRPQEIVDWGSNQTIWQSRLYGNHIKWASDLPVPEPDMEMLHYARAMGSRAYATALGSPCGPVHLNIPFRDPLAPVEVTEDITVLTKVDGCDATTDPQSANACKSVSLGVLPNGEAIGRDLAKELKKIPRGLIVCGPQTNVKLSRALLEVSKTLGYPVLADCLSQLRFGDHDVGSVIANYDMFLRCRDLTEKLKPDVVIRFGRWPTSKILGELLGLSRHKQHILVTDGDWNDPLHLATNVLQYDSVSFCKGLASANPKLPVTSIWLSQWHVLSTTTQNSIQGYMDKTEELFEGKVLYEVSKLLPNGSILFVGNSMPVRDMESFLPSSPGNINIMANRGASGIDGVLSTALGSGVGTQVPVTLILGDLSFFHDVNGLLMAKSQGLNATIIVINNDGGGIFSFLPQAQYRDNFEEVLGTPHGLTFKHAAAMFGLSYKCVRSWEDFKQSISKSLTRFGTEVIEIPGNRARNVELHKSAYDSVSNALDDVCTGY